jgi:hypothetical protein
MRHRLVLTTLVATLAVVLAAPVAAQSPGPTSVATVEPSAEPGPVLVWPWVEVDDAEPSTWRAVVGSQPPTASRRHGRVRLDLWVIPPAASTGEPLSAVLRITNVSARRVIHPDEVCSSESGLSVDVREVIPEGLTQSGAAADFKALVAKDLGLWGSSPPWRPRQPHGTGLVVQALADCSVEDPWRDRWLAPGAHMDLPWSWFPTVLFDEQEGRALPLAAGPVTVRVWWMATPGTRPDHGPVWWKRARVATIAARVDLPGTTPAAPSALELVDAALTDADFRAWVEADPSQASWILVSVMAPYDADDPFAQAQEPNGIVEVTLRRDVDGREVEGRALVDPVTRRVIAYREGPWCEPYCG